MALKKITMQDIADACGLSRNTVSKVFNERGDVPEATKARVLLKARELGYHQPPAGEETVPAVSGGQVAMLTQKKALSHTFGAFFITSFTDQISRWGYTMKIYEISRAEILEKQLPPGLDLEQTRGFVGIELFDRGYLDMVCGLGKPTVFVDGYARASLMPIFCDYVTMENVASESALVRRMIAGGARRIGFVGDYMHCNSFYERWIGYTMALTEAGLVSDPACCITEKDGPCYGDTAWLTEKLSAMPEIPDAFACANDFLAIHLMTALKRLGRAVPDDVMITGFDGSMEAGLVDPHLTTATIHSEEIGRLAASILHERIRSPEGSFRLSYVQSTPVWGGSTR